MLAVPSPEPSPPPLYSSTLSSSSSSNATSIFLIVLLIIATAIFASVFFHLSAISSPAADHPLLRRLPSPAPPLPTLNTPPPPPASETPPPSFPLFPVPSAASVLHKSPDCAVCLSPFLPSDDLRLLPSCRHAFHLKCIDMWLQSTPSCPLCRSPAAPEVEIDGSSSFQVEIDPSFSLGTSVEHLVGEEAEIGVDRVSTTDRVKDENDEGGGEMGIQAEVREEDRVGGRGWLREYLDRISSSASSSLSFSGRLSSHRFDSGSVESVAGGDGRSWDLEGVEWVEESGLAGIYRWFVGM